MNNFFTELKNSARANKLSQSEKQAMRVRLYNYLEQNPMGTFAAPAALARPVRSTFFFFSPRYMVPLAFILIIGLGSGTAFAAQGALPGDTLYPVKINVNEAVQTALATSPTAKAEVQAQLATTRLEEAETLAATGKLDANATAALASNFTAHAKAAQAVTQIIESSDPGTAAQLGADFNSTLAAHGAILTQIGDDSKSDETIQNSNTLAMAIQQETNDDHQDTATNTDTSVVVIATATPVAAAPTNDSRIRTFAAAMPVASSTTTTTAPLAKAKGKEPVVQSVNPNDAKIAASLGAQASTSLAAMAKDFAAIKPALDSDTSAQLTAQMANLQTRYASASAELAAGNTSAAVHDFAAVIRTSVKLDAYFNAGKNINIKLLLGLLSATTSTNNVGNTSTSVFTKITDSTATTSTEIQTSQSSENSRSSADDSGPSVSNSSDINVGNSVHIETHN